MIKFFRKIRQKLLTENKFSKYLLYAIGEIALVMIGILLALQVNNWNTKRLNVDELKKSLYFLLDDLEMDKIQLKELKDERLLRTKQCSEFIESYEFSKPLMSEDPIDNFRLIIGELKFEPNQSGFEKVRSSKIFESNSITEIRNKIRVYNKALEFILFQEFNQNAHTEAMEKEMWINGTWNKIYPTLRANINQDKFEEPSHKIDFAKLISDSEPLKAIFARYEIAMPWLVRKYDDLINKGEDLKLEIEKYVKVE